MPYTKQNFEDGQVLMAEHLNNIEDGIKANADNIENHTHTNYPTRTEMTAAINSAIGSALGGSY